MRYSKKSKKTFLNLGASKLTEPKTQLKAVLIDSSTAVKKNQCKGRLIRPLKLTQCLPLKLTIQQITTHTLTISATKSIRSIRLMVGKKGLTDADDAIVSKARSTVPNRQQCQGPEVKHSMLDIYIRLIGHFHYSKQKGTALIQLYTLVSLIRPTVSLAQTIAIGCRQIQMYPIMLDGLKRKYIISPKKQWLCNNNVTV